MTLGSEDRTGDSMVRWRWDFTVDYCIVRKEPYGWSTTVNNVVYEVEEQGGSQDSALGDAWDNF